MNGIYHKFLFKAYNIFITYGILLMSIQFQSLVVPYKRERESDSEHMLHVVIWHSHVQAWHSIELQGLHSTACIDCIRLTL